MAERIADALDAPLDVFVVRKIGTPHHEELAMGAIASGGVVVRNEDVIRSLAIRDQAFEQVASREREELARRERLYRGEASFPSLEGKAVIVVDDGLATGSTMRAAVAALKQHRPSRIVVAVPTGARESCAMIAQDADEVVCAVMPDQFYAVGMWYEDFSQTTDDEVREILGRARRR